MIKELGDIAADIVIKIYNNLKLSEEIDQIYCSIAQVYNGMSLAFNTSAASALEAANHSNAPAHEIRGAIINYRDSFNTLAVALQTKRTVGFFKKKEVDLIQDKEVIKLNMAKIARFVAILYKYLNEKENFDHWKAKAIVNFEQGIGNLTISTYKLHENNQIFVREESYEVKEVDNNGYPPIITSYTEYMDVPSEMGLKYIEAYKKKLVKDFSKSIDNSQYVTSKE